MPGTMACSISSRARGHSASESPDRRKPTFHDEVMPRDERLRSGLSIFNQESPIVRYYAACSVSFHETNTAKQTIRTIHVFVHQRAFLHSGRAGLPLVTPTWNHFI